MNAVQARDAVLMAVIAEIDRVGGAVSLVRRGKGSHRLVYWTLGERAFVQTVAIANGHWRQLHNARAEVRRRARTARMTA